VEIKIRKAFEMQPSWRGSDYAMFKQGYLAAISGQCSSHNATEDLVAIRDDSVYLLMDDYDVDRRDGAVVVGVYSTLKTAEFGNIKAASLFDKPIDEFSINEWKVQ
jgi:hypothetical protein